MAKFRLEFDGDEIDAACSYNGGQSSMLYAVCSTGALSLGTRRPDPDYTDGEWFAELLGRLESEVEDAIEISEKTGPDGDDDEDFYFQAEALGTMLDKIQRALG